MSTIRNEETNEYLNEYLKEDLYGRKGLLEFINKHKLALLATIIIMLVIFKLITSMYISDSIAAYAIDKGMVRLVSWDLIEIKDSDRDYTMNINDIIF